MTKKYYYYSKSKVLKVKKKDRANRVCLRCDILFPSRQSCHRICDGCRRITSNLTFIETYGVYE